MSNPVELLAQITEASRLLRSDHGWTTKQIADQIVADTAMDWEAKLARLQELCPTTLEMRYPGNWYVSPHGSRHISSRSSGMLYGNYGNGRTPKLAVEDDWLQMTTLPPDNYIVIHGPGRQRRHVRWDGNAWITLEVIA